MTNQERRERRREAGRKAAATRREKAHQVEPGRIETPEEADRREQLREHKRREQLRAVIARAQEIRRESDLHHLAHIRRWSHRPIDWTPEQIDEAGRFLSGFIRPDGTPQPHPIRRKGKWRL
jgi:hypothetical protein